LGDDIKTLAQCKTIHSIGVTSIFGNMLFKRYKKSELAHYLHYSGQKKQLVLRFQSSGIYKSGAS
jgi:hypothetical protein